MSGLIETEIIQDSGDYSTANMIDEAAFNDVGLTDKQIEPSNKISSFTTRNQVMGNVDDSQFRFLNEMKNEAVSLLGIPKSLGGWLARRFARNILENNELTLVMSGSRNGYARELLNTRKAIISKSESTNPKTKKLGIGIGSD